MKSTLLLAGALVAGIAATAQDTARHKKEVNITSTFKPVLKDAAKINFNAAPPTADTSKPRLRYSIPNQNLAVTFQPGTLKPLALQVDTGGRWSNESYVKVGYGNLNTPYVQAGLALGDGKTAGLNIYARHVSSQGKIKFQDYSNTNVDLNAFFQTSKNIEWDARFGGLQEKYNKYGFVPNTLTFPQDSLNVRFTTWRGRLSFHNINRTELGLSYAPEIRIDVFNDQLHNSESNTFLNLPLRKSISDAFDVDLGVTANLTRYKPNTKLDQTNNYLEVSPSVLYKSSNFSIQAGIRPAWDNNSFKLFPNVLADISSTDKRFTFQLGWTGDLRNSGYQYLAGLNPWIWAPDSIYNTRIEQRFAGFKGSVGDHFTYSARVGYDKYNNQPLFINDTMSGKSFMVVNEPQMKVVNLAGELGYNIGEQLSVISKLTINQYSTQVNQKAWGLIPLEFTTTLRLQVLKDLYVNSEIYAFDGPWSLTKAGSKNLPAAFDFNAGLEFKILPNLKLWAQFNNIFNSQYQRWNQYPVYGFNFLGGVVFSFGQNNTRATTDR
jgi:hypothetical protein